MSISHETLEKIRKQLHEAKNIGGSVPNDLYSHLTEVFNRIMMYHQADAYEKFEEISTLVKRTHLNFADPKHDFEVNASAAAKSAEDKAREAWIRKSKNLLNEVSEIVEADSMYENTVTANVRSTTWCSTETMVCSEKGRSTLFLTSRKRLKCLSGLESHSARKKHTNWANPLKDSQS
jgi:hypothetical protein